MRFLSLLRWALSALVAALTASAQNWQVDPNFAPVLESPRDVTVRPTALADGGALVTHGGAFIDGADETTNLGVFSVGRATATNQSLFRSDVTYDGVADLAVIAIMSPSGKFGGVRAANASFWATRGFTGLYAPGVTFTGPVYLGDIDARTSALPKLILGGSTDVRITGGDLAQTNQRAIDVKGITQLTMTAGTTSHGVAQSAKTNQARLEEDGQNVVNPPPAQ